MTNSNWEKFRAKVICFLLAVLIWLILHQVQNDQGFNIFSL